MRKATIVSLPRERRNHRETTKTIQKTRFLLSSSW